MRIRLLKDRYAIYNFEIVKLKEIDNDCHVIYGYLRDKAYKIAEHKDRKIAEIVFNNIITLKEGEIYTPFENDEEYIESKKIKIIDRKSLEI